MQHSPRKPKLIFLTAFVFGWCAAMVGLQIWIIWGTPNRSGYSLAAVLNILFWSTFAIVLLWQIICASRSKSVVVGRDRKICILLVISLVACLALKAVSYGLAVIYGQPIVEAIKHYNHANGRPPQCLEKLIPTYLKVLPGTGLSYAPDFSYDLTFQDSNARTTSLLYGQPIWTLTVHGLDTDINLFRVPGVPDDMPMIDDRPIEKMFGQR